MSKHTSTPWKVDADGSLRGNGGFYIGQIADDFGDKTTSANRRLIVMCVNAHDELVAIVQEVAKGRANMIDEDFARARSVLAKLKGREG